MTETKWLSQEAYDKLAAELAERKGPMREEISARIGAAREEGDLRENGGYHAAKDDQGKNEARIRQLEATLKSAKIGAPEAAEDEVAHGKVITVRFHALDMEETFLLASKEEEAHSSLQVFSSNSPLGAAVTGKKVGDEASYETPTGKQMTVEILKVEEYQG